MDSTPKSIFDFQRIIRFFTKEEVKTPLSFLFKVVPYLIAGWIVILYAPISDDLKYKLIIIISSALLFLCGIVLVFAWFRPKNLVYGESGHRAEYKIDYGSEKKVIDKEQLEALLPVHDKKQHLIESK